MDDGHYKGLSDLPLSGGKPESHRPDHARVGNWFVRPDTRILGANFSMAIQTT